MEVILTENIPNLGETGDVVTVAGGYGRNYLLPQKLAVEANRKNIKEFEHRKRVIEKKRLKDMADAKALVDRIESLNILISRKAGEQDKLYGSVSTADIAAEMSAKGVDIDRRKIVLEHPIKAVGEFKIPVRIFPEISATLKLKVTAEAEDAE